MRPLCTCAHDLVLFNQVGHGCLRRWSSQPTSGTEHSEGQRIEHGGRVYSTDSISTPEDLSAELRRYGMSQIEQTHAEIWRTPVAGRNC
jgi:hypothetical protein